jgi:uncharacterized protein YecT (DUF1311 family)
MRKALALLCVVMLLGVAASAGAAPPHPIDVELEKRIDADSSTAGMVQATHDAAKAWEKLLNDNYDALLGKLSKEEQEKLRASQRAWVQFRDLEFAFSAQFWSGFSGTMYQVSAAASRCDVVKKRALELGSYLANLEDR